MNDIERLYQQTILDYNSRNDLKKDLEKANFVERGHNPSCGDDLTLLLQIEGEIVKDASFIGSGCAISTASTAMLVENIKNKKIDEVKNIVDEFFFMMRNDDEKEHDILNDAVLMKFVANMPARVKCATLSWHSLNVVLDKIKKEKKGG